MARYVDGFVIPMPTRNLKAYRAMAKACSKVWIEHGALQYVESTVEDANPQCGVPFPTLCGATKKETVVFAWILYKSRAHRDRVNKKVMADPRMAKLMEKMDPKKPIFDVSRLSYSGFEVIVEA